MLNKIDRC